MSMSLDTSVLRLSVNGMAQLSSTYRRNVRFFSFVDSEELWNCALRTGSRFFQGITNRNARFCRFVYRFFA